MKTIKNNSIVKVFVAFALLCALIGSIDAMKRNNSIYTVKSKSKYQPQRLIDFEDVWVKTSDGQIMAVPKWQIDQMKVLQVLFVSQKGTNNKDNPIAAVMVTAEGLQLLQKTLYAIATGYFDAWYKSIREEFNKSLKDKSIGEGILRKLTITAENVGATSLFALLAALLLPQEIQSSMVPKVIEPVIAYLEQPKTLLGNDEDAVNCVAFSPDAECIVAGLRDGSLILWNSKIGKQIKILKGHEASVSCVAFSPDSKYIVSGSVSGENNFILWDGKTADQIKILGSHSGGVSCVAFSPDGNYIVSGSQQYGTLILWNGKTGTQIKILQDNGDPVECVAFTPVGNCIFAGLDSSQNALVGWDARTGQQGRILHGHEPSRVLCVAISLDGNCIVSGSDGEGNNLILWNFQIGMRAILKGHSSGNGNDGVDHVAFSSDGNYMVSVSDGKRNNLILWNGKTGEQIKILEGHSVRASCVAFSPDGNYIVSGSYYGTNNLILWDGKTGEQIKILKDNRDAVFCVAFSPDGNYIISGSNGEGNNLRLWNLVNKDVLDFIKTKLTISQARFIYRLYLAMLNQVPVMIDENDLDYFVYKSLPHNVQKLINEFFSFQLVSKTLIEAASEGGAQ